MIHQPLIDLLNLQPVKDPDAYFPFECMLWDTRIGTCKVQSCDLQMQPLREGMILVLAHGNGGVAYVTVNSDLLLDIKFAEEFVIKELDHHLNKNR